MGTAFCDVHRRGGDWGRQAAALQAFVKLALACLSSRGAPRSSRGAKRRGDLGLLRFARNDGFRNDTHLNDTSFNDGSGKHPSRLLHLRGHLAQVVQAVAQAEFELRQALETVADDVFIGHANAAVQLDRFLAHMAGGAPNLVLGPRHRQ